jgi:hypothetical protein
MNEESTTVSLASPSLTPIGDPRANRVSAGNKVEAFRRVRVGIMGLAAILLLIGLATAMRSLITDQVAVSSQAQGQIVTNTATQPDKDEPLAELGVMPGSAEKPKAAAPARPR